MYIFDLKINKSLLKKRLEKELRYDLKYAGEFELVAKCYMYLANKEDCISYLDRAIIATEELYKKFAEQGKLLECAEKKLNCANYYRMLGCKEKMENILKEIAPVYNASCNGHIKEKPENFRSFYFEWCTILFYSGNYEDAHNIGKFIRHGTVAPREYAKGLLKNDKNIIEKTLSEVMTDIKEDKIRPFYNSMNIQDPWEWYEIGRQLLGLPSVLDIFKEDSQ